MQADAMCIGYAMVLKMQLKFPFIFSVNFIQHNYMQTTHCTKRVSQDMGAVKIQEYEKVQCFTKRLSVVCLCFISNSPVSHCIPVHPTSQVQVLGDVQFPPF